MHRFHQLVALSGIVSASEFPNSIVPMSTQSPVRLLILDNSQNRAEELIVMLRNSGRATRAQHVESHESLQSLLKNKSWDLFLSRPEANDVTAEQAIALIKEFEKDVPFILLVGNNDVESITAGLQMGATDVALEDDEERLRLIINRELENLENRRARRRAELELKEAERRCQLLLESSKAAISYVHDGMHIFANSVYCEFFGFDSFEDLEIVPLIDLIVPDDQANFKSFLKSFREQEEASAEYNCVHNDGSAIQVQMTLSRAQYDGEPCTQVILRPKVDEKEIESRLEELSYQDQLTGLPNRRKFIELLDIAVERAVEDNDLSIVFYIVLDKFEDTVTQSGIADADLIIREVASLISSKLDESHLLARFGDDVFTLLYPGSNADKAGELAEDIRKTIESKLIEVAGKTYQLTLSIGLAQITETSNSAQTISRSREAISETSNGNCIAVYRSETPAVQQEKSSAQDDFRELVVSAFDKGRLKLLFQPIISLHGDDDEQFEVLLRLLDDEDNELTPDKFLDIVHEENLSIKLDRWVILQSIKLLAAHRSEGSLARLFINVTHLTIADDTFLPWVNVALKAARLPIDAVIFQFHESDAITYMKQAGIFTKGLKELHCKASINHFGCSLNPFNTLKHISVDYVKLDGSFAHDIDSDEEKRQELMDTITSLQAKGILTAISGVESPQVLSTLWEAGLNFIQGHYLSVPLETMDYDFASEDM